MSSEDKEIRLTVIRKFHSRTKTGKAVWKAEVQCACGKRKVVTFSEIGRSVFSCGCLRRELAAERNLVHGASGTPLFQIWQHMHERVAKKYAGRGIKVCDEWREYQAFHAYVEEHLGPKPRGYSIDRINNDGHYEPGNVQWSSPVRQQRNKSNTRWITAFGKTQSVHDWAEQYGLFPATIWARIQRGVPPEEAVSRPLDPK